MAMNYWTTSSKATWTLPRLYVSDTHQRDEWEGDVPKGRFSLGSDATHTLWAGKGSDPFIRASHLVDVTPR